MMLRRAAAAAAASSASALASRASSLRAPAAAPLLARRLHDDITSMVGNTPVVRLNRVAPPHVTMYAKCEFMNPVRGSSYGARRKACKLCCLPSPLCTRARACASLPPRWPSCRVRGQVPASEARWLTPLVWRKVSSVKDRLGLAILQDAERRGLLRPGDTVVEATSGNTGIALAALCAQRGYKCVITMVETFSVERRKIMRGKSEQAGGASNKVSLSASNTRVHSKALGAKVITTPAAGKAVGMVNKAQELAEKHGWFLARQFENDANARYHAETTGPEILRDFAGRRLDYWVTGYGTGGTFNGAGRVLKAARPELEIVLSEPDTAQMLASGVPTERKAGGAPAADHPNWAPHPIQGWAPSFIPKVLQDGLELGLGEKVMPVTGAEGVDVALRLAREEGIFTGISGGATVATALKVAETAPEGSVLLAMLPDTAERYLSTPLFASVEAEMSAEEQEIADSV